MTEPQVQAAGGLVVRPDGRIAVIHRPRYDDWSLPKGKLERRESFEEAAVREVLEETGLHIDPGIALDVHSSHFTGARADGLVEDYHGIHLIFAARVLPESEDVEPHVIEQDGTTDLAAWVPRSEALDLDLLSAARYALTTAAAS